MATTYTWAVNTLDRELSDGYVSTVHYTVNAMQTTPTLLERMALSVWSVLKLSFLTLT